MTLKRMDNILIVVDDLEAAKAFFVELGMELEGEALVEGEWAGHVVGLENVRADLLDPARLQAYLAQGRWFRTASANGTLSLGGYV